MEAFTIFRLQPSSSSLFLMFRFFFCFRVLTTFLFRRPSGGWREKKSWFLFSFGGGGIGENPAAFQKGREMYPLYSSGKGSPLDKSSSKAKVLLKTCSLFFKGPDLKSMLEFPFAVYGYALLWQICLVTLSIKVLKQGRDPWLWADI